VPPTPAEVEVPPPDPEPTPGAADYQAGYQLLLAGDFAAAAARLREVAARAVDPELRGAARALADLADAYAAKQARILFGAAAVAAATATRIPTTAAPASWSRPPGLDLHRRRRDRPLDADVRGGAAILLGATALGLTGSLFGTRGRRISGGAAEAYSTGMLVGLANGLLLAEPLGADGSEPFQVAAARRPGARWGHRPPLRRSGPADPRPDELRRDAGDPGVRDRRARAGGHGA
jgi:hypothetical protein